MLLLSLTWGAELHPSVLRKSACLLYLGKMKVKVCNIMFSVSSLGPIWTSAVSPLPQDTASVPQVLIVYWLQWQSELGLESISSCLIVATLLTDLCTYCTFHYGMCTSVSPCLWFCVPPQYLAVLVLFSWHQYPFPPSNDDITRNSKNALIIFDLYMGMSNILSALLKWWHIEYLDFDSVHWSCKDSSHKTSLSEVASSSC